jgi:hypothetical protein
MTTAARAPTSDESISGTWSGSAGTRYTLVDDYPDTTPNDILTHGTTAGNICFGFSAFTIPADATSISVQVMYRDDEASSGTNSCAGRLKVGGSYYNASTHNPSTTATNRSDSWATNPKTTQAWTPAQINGTDGTNDLQGFGIYSGDANPTFFVTGIQVQVTYTRNAADSRGGGETFSNTLTRLSQLIRTSGGVETLSGTLNRCLSSLRMYASDLNSSGLISRLIDSNRVYAGQLNIAGDAVPSMDIPPQSYSGSYSGLVENLGKVSVFKEHFRRVKYIDISQGQKFYG